LLLRSFEYEFVRCASMRYLLAAAKKPKKVPRDKNRARCVEIGCEQSVKGSRYRATPGSALLWPKAIAALTAPWRGLSY